MSRQGWQETLVMAETDGPVLTAAAAASCIPTGAKCTLPAGYWDIGRGLHILATGRISSLITTPGTARFDVRFASAVVFDSLAISLATAAARVNVGWYLDILLTCRAIGSGTSANMMGQGAWQSSDILANPLDNAGPAGSVLLPFNSAPAVGAGFDSTAALAVDMFFTQTVATGSLTVHQFKVVALN